VVGGDFALRRPPAFCHPPTTSANNNSPARFPDLQITAPGALSSLVYIRQAAVNTALLIAKSSTRGLLLLASRHSMARAPKSPKADLTIR